MEQLGVTALASVAGARPLGVEFPGPPPDPSPHHGSANAHDPSAFEPSQGDGPPCFNSPPRSPQPSWPNSCTRPPEPPIRWTRDAAGDWSRYAAELARRRDHQP